MQFLTLQHNSWDEPGVLYDGRTTGLKGAGFDDLLSVIAGGADALDRVSRWLYSQPHSEPFDPAVTRLRAPIPKPPKIVLCSTFSVYGVADMPRGTVVDEKTPLETHPELRDPYSQSKLKQEQLVWEYAEKRKVPVVVVRPGVIYGPGGPAMSSRIGLNLFGVFLHLGGDNALPLTFVDNCADAIVVAGQSPRAVGEVYNVVDDDIVDAKTYLARYKRDVKPLKSVRVPYPALTVLSHAVAKYHAFSRGQLPAVFTPYKTRTTWKGNRFENAKMKSLGWSPKVSTEEGLRRAFERFRPSAA